MRLEYARFLLGWRDDPDAAIAEATAALNVTPGRNPLDALALAQYVKWDQLRESDPARARQYLESARLHFPDQASVIRSAVGGLGKSSALQHLVLTLVAEGASLDARAADGYTPLLCAITCDAPESVGWLLDHGAGVDVRQAYDQSTPLVWASAKNDIPSLVLLARRGANINAANRAGRTALWFAAYNGNEAMVKTLLELDAAVDQAGEDRNTPLIQAAQSGLTPIVRLLLDAGADPSIRSATQDAEGYAKASGHVATAMLIRSRMKK
ncbi:MAG: ankyrin repeat domain-containing protein [Comamonadaceae bacterium]|nr:MAG: ankyrin repeat domain-containing protein [Comamonadaceae bacterium]